MSEAPRLYAFSGGTGPSEWLPRLAYIHPASADTSEGPFKGQIGPFLGKIRDGLWVELIFLRFGDVFDLFLHFGVNSEFPHGRKSLES